MSKLFDFFFGRWGSLTLALGGLVILVSWFSVDRYLYGQRKEQAGVQKERATTQKKATINVQKATSARNASRRRDGNRRLRPSPYVRARD